MKLNRIVPFLILILFAFQPLAQAKICNRYLGNSTEEVFVPYPKDLTLKNLVGEESFQNDLFFVFTFQTVFVVYKGRRFHGGSIMECNRSSSKTTYSLPNLMNAVVYRFPRNLAQNKNPKTVFKELEKQFFLSCARAASVVHNEIFDEKIYAITPHHLLETLTQKIPGGSLFMIGPMDYSEFKQMQREEDLKFAGVRSFFAGMILLSLINYISIFF